MLRAGLILFYLHTNVILDPVKHALADAIHFHELLDACIPAYFFTIEYDIMGSTYTNAC